MELLDKYIEMSIEASKRVRYVILVLATTSFIAFISCWNSLEFNWVQREKRYIEIANIIFLIEDSCVNLEKKNLPAYELVLEKKTVKYLQAINR